MPFDPFDQFRMDDHVALVTGGGWISGQILQVAGGPKRVRLVPED